MKNLIFLLLCFLPSSLYAERFYKTSYGWKGSSGKQYILGQSGPVCSNPNCAMCRQLSAALKAGKTPSSVNNELVPTPMEEVDRMLALLSPSPGKVVLDPGCGDGRILIQAAKNYSTYGIGIEINPSTASLASSLVKKEGLDSRITITQGDSRKFKFTNADYVTLFLFPELIEELVPKFLEMRSGSKVISFSHPIPLQGTIQNGNFYIWTKD